jgi:hypothetical protein
MEEFGNRVRYWQDASEEEWEQGLEGMLRSAIEARVLISRRTELKERFSNMLQKVLNTRL